ncbi:MAG: SIMPL domain-containing protein [Bacillota bacterium]
MKNKSLTIFLTFFLLFNLVVVAQALSLSTISSAKITATPSTAFVKLYLSSTDQNKSRLNNDFHRNLTDIKEELIDNSSLNDSQIKQSTINSSSYTKKIGYNNPKIYQQEVELELSLTNQDHQRLHKKTSDLIEIINNLQNDYDFQVQKAYYHFDNCNHLEKKLLEKIITKNKQKSSTLTQLLDSGSTSLTEVKELNSPQIENYEEQIDLSQPQLPKSTTFETKLRFYYQSN